MKIPQHLCQNSDFLITWHSVAQSCTCVCACVRQRRIRGEAAQAVSGSPCAAAGGSVCARRTRRASVSHVGAQRVTKRTMRLFNVSTLLLFFFSSGTDTHSFSLSQHFTGLNATFRLSHPNFQTRLCVLFVGEGAQ